MRTPSSRVRCCTVNASTPKMPVMASSKPSAANAMTRTAAVAVGKWEWPQQRGVRERENGAVDADPECQRGDRDDREDRRASHLTQRERQVGSDHLQLKASQLGTGTWNRKRGTRNC